MLSEEQIDQLANTLNESLDIPFTGEDSEKELLVALLEQIDNQLGDIGEEFHGIIDAVADGSIDEDEIEEMKGRAIEILNEQVDIPFVGEESEAAMLRPVVDALVEAAQQRIAEAMEE